MQSSGWVGSKDKLDMNLALEEDRKKKNTEHIYTILMKSVVESQRQEAI